MAMFNYAMVGALGTLAALMLFMAKVSMTAEAPQPAAIIKHI